MPFDRGEIPRNPEEPETGTFLVRLVPGGPLVPAEIILRRGLWGASINGEPPRSWEAEPFRALDLERVWLGQRCTEAEYRRRLELSLLDGHPASRPREKIDLVSLPPILGEP